MPNRGSWNGRWSGENNLYVVVESFSQKAADKILSQPSYYYRWDDGWGASIKVKAVDGVEARRLKKLSRGFCGYEWMLKSIFLYGAIYADDQIPKQTTPLDGGASKDDLPDNRSTPEPVRVGEPSPIGRSDWERAARGEKDRP